MIYELHVIPNAYDDFCFKGTKKQIFDLINRECEREYGYDLYKWHETKPQCEDELLKLSLDFISIGLDLEYTIQQLKNN